MNFDGFLSNLLLSVIFMDFYGIFFKMIFLCMKYRIYELQIYGIFIKPTFINCHFFEFSMVFFKMCL
jgi:hypothetical protein